MLFGYSFDSGPVEVVDLTVIPAYLPPIVIQNLFNPGCIKKAYNAAFEWYCLSRYFRLHENPNYPPEAWLPQWRCTMLHGLYCGFPGKLSLIGPALGLPADKQKASTGQALIRYFCVPCKPTKSNGRRTRNLPHHDPEKWNLFKEYNRQDVVTEMAVDEKLKNFPVPDWIQKQWITDQIINARGVAVDRELIHSALWCGETVRQQLLDEATRISGLDNPNSVAQLTKWLEEEIEEEIPDLKKDSVTALLGRDLGSDDARRMLEIRQQLGKTSTKKYDAMALSAGPDGRIRGLMQFYGANRTGRWCLTGDHEVLTPRGWERLDTWRGGEIACWTPLTECISFQKAKALQFDYSGEMISISHQRCEQLSTPDHKMPYLKKDGTWGVSTIDVLAKHRFTIPFTGRRIVSPNEDSNALRVLVMTQADGHYTKEGDIRYHFKKERKFEQCKTLLRRCQIPFLESTYTDGVKGVVIKNRYAPLWLRQFHDKTFDYWLLNESADVIFDELPNWDGCYCGPNSLQYATTNKQNAEILQALAILSGRSATLITKKRDKENWKVSYVLNIWNAPGRGTAIRIEQVGRGHFTGKVYCAETPTGFFLVRRNGKVWVTGNSGRMVQPQNLPQTHLEPLALARQLVKERRLDALQLCYGSIPDTLSQLIRTAFVPAPGHILIDADFSAIEARIIAWLAGEEWRLEVFRTHGKIYEASAEQMFNLPPGSVKKGDPMRQRGKVAELALGYQGGTGALISMGALKNGLTEEELPDIVNRWRAANPRIVQLWYDFQDAAFEVVQNARPITTHGITFARECDLANGLDFMTMRLPSGRKLYYAQPRIITNRFGGPSIGYMGLNQKSKKWEQQETYGGKLVENCIQAIARDCLAEAVERLEAAGYRVVFHVHDEVVIEAVPGAGSLEDVCKILSEPMPWAPDLLLGADGWVGEFYRKD